MSKLVMSAEDFGPLVPSIDTRWGKPVEVETRRRIALSVATYGYEIADSPIMTDTEWDRAATMINREQGTCHPIMDEFFVTQFTPMTGMWIHQHPELRGIERIFNRYYNALRDYYEKPAVQRMIRGLV